MRPILLLVLVSACTTDTSNLSTCNPNNWREFIGQPETAIYGALANLRVVRDGEAITQDFNPERLNAEVGNDGNITRFACY